MTKPREGSTKHSWLLDDLAAVAIDLRTTADGILAAVAAIAQGDNQRAITQAALYAAQLQQIHARLIAVIAEMRELVQAARPPRVRAELEDIRAELAALRAMVEGHENVQ